MPNQIATSKQRLSITMPKDLVKQIDQIAKLSDRDRTYVILHLVQEQLGLIDGEPIKPPSAIVKAREQLSRARPA